MQGLLCFIKSAVEKLKFKSVQLNQRNTVDGKLVPLWACNLRDIDLTLFQHDVTIIKF